MPGAKETMSGRALHLTLSAVVMLTAAPGFSRAAPAPPTMALGAIWDARWIAHPQVPGSAFSVVAKVATGERAKAMVARVLEDRSLTQCTLYFRFYVIRAMAEVGLGDRYVAELQPWRDMLALGLTTFAEKPEPTRSDCHAWSACPNYDLLALVCGITPDAPGFRRVRIAPALGPLAWVDAKMPHPNGEITLQLRQMTGGGIEARVALPAGVSGVFSWGGTERALAAGTQTVAITGKAEKAK